MALINSSEAGFTSMGSLLKRKRSVPTQNTVSGLPYSTSASWWNEDLKLSLEKNRHPTSPVLLKSVVGIEIRLSTRFLLSFLRSIMILISPLSFGATWMLLTQSEGPWWYSIISSSNIRSIAYSTLILKWKGIFRGRQAIGLGSSTRCRCTLRPQGRPTTSKNGTKLAHPDIV